MKYCLSKRDSASDRPNERADVNEIKNRFAVTLERKVLEGTDRVIKDYGRVLKKLGNT